MEQDLFPEVDGLTDEILADLDVLEIGRRENVFNDFPKVRISSPAPEQADDILQHAIRNALSEQEILSLQGGTHATKGSDGFPQPIPVEVSSQSNDQGDFVAKKSSPLDARKLNGEGVLLIQDDPDDPSSDEPKAMDQDKIDEYVKSAVSSITRGKKKGKLTKNSQHAGKVYPLRSGEVQQDQPPSQASSAGDIVISNGKKKFVPPKFSFDPVKVKEKLTRNQPPSIATQITRAVVERDEQRSSVSTGNSYFKNGETGFSKHDFPEVMADLLRGPDPVPLDVPGVGDFLSVQEIASQDNRFNRTVPAGIVSFVLVECTDGWKIPDVLQWEEFTNAFEVKIITEFPELKYVLKQANRWRGCGSFGLDGSNLELLERWRDLVPQMNPNFNTFPRDALMVSQEVSIMMKSELRSFPLQSVPSALFSRNTSLQGRCRVTYSKTYGAHEFTMNEESKDGWRLVYLEGDSLFLQSLSQFLECESFGVGCGMVTIRGGGVRKPMFPKKRFAMRKWFESRKWFRDDAPPALRSLMPVSRQTPQVQQVHQEPNASNVNAQLQQLVEKVNGGVKPRTRSERLKLARAKKAAALARSISI